MEKKCATCEQIKPIEDFLKAKGTRDGHGSWCKPCRKIYSKLWSERKRKKVKEERKTKPWKASKSELKMMLFLSGYRKCGKCKKTKELHEFFKDKSSKWGIKTICRSCKAESYAALPEEKKKEKREKVKKWYIKNNPGYDERGEKRKQRAFLKKQGKNLCSNCKQIKDLSDFTRQGSEGNQCKRCLNDKQWARIVNNPERHKKKKERDKIWMQEYRKNKPELVRKTMRESQKRYRERNPLLVRFKSMFSYSLKRNEVSKDDRTFEILPYTLEELKEHLETTFDDKMNWDNYGSYWAVDHIKPLAMLPFDSYDDENFKIAWALENLQALGKKENIKKNSFYEGKKHWYPKKDGEK